MPRSRVERSTIGRFARQPALDGVRAIAVALVLLFHQGWLSGGYVGVSVFFTLSGYLITSLALVEHDRTGRLDVRAFYGRRVRRLLPASLACLVGVVVLAFTGVFDAVEHLRRDLWGALLQVYNWVVARRRRELRRAGRRRRRRPLTARPLLVAGDRGAVLLGVAARPRRGPAPARRGAHGARSPPATLVFAVAAPLIAGVLGRRRGLLGDAGAARRDPRRCAARRRAARAGGERPCHRPRVCSRRPGSASSSWAGDRLAERVRVRRTQGWLPVFALASGRPDPRPAGAERVPPAAPVEPAARRPRRHQLRRLPVPLAGVRRARRGAHEPADGAAVRRCASSSRWRSPWCRSATSSRRFAAPARAGCSCRSARRRLLAWSPRPSCSCRPRPGRTG